MTIKHVQLFIGILTLGVYSNTSAGLNYDISATATLKHSDNMLLSNDQQKNDIEQRAELAINLEKKTRHLEAAANYRTQYSDYIKNSLNDETIVEGQTNLTWTPLPQSINWDFFTTTRNLQRDRRDADTANNKEKRTIISTGPLFGAQISNVNNFQLAGRYTTTRLENSDQSDNNRLSGQFNWIHRLSPTRDFSSGVEYTKTKFEYNNQPDIENSSFYISFTSKLSTSQFRLKAGYNESKHGSLDDAGGPLLEAAIEYNPTNQRISFVAVNLITDSTIGLGNNPTIIDENIIVDDANFNEIDIVERLFSELRYINETLCNSCTFTGSLTYDDQDFDIEPRDETSLTTELDFQYRINSTVNTGISLARETINFNSDDREDDIDSLRIYSEYSATPSIAVYVLLGFEQRQSDIITAEFDELSVEISVRYRLN